MLDEIGTPDHAEPWIRAAVDRGDRLMGFGHRVYKTDDPRSLFLRDVARSLGGAQVEFAEQVERTAVEVLGELKPGRKLYTNVEFYAGIVMDTCGIPARCSPRPSRRAGSSAGPPTSSSRRPTTGSSARRPLRRAAPTPAGPERLTTSPDDREAWEARAGSDGERKLGGTVRCAVSGLRQSHSPVGPWVGRSPGAPQSIRGAGHAARSATLPGCADSRRRSG